LTSTKTRTNQL